MARFESLLPTELIKQFETLEINTEKMLGEMVEAGAEVAEKNIIAKIPRALYEGLGSDNIITSRVYKTPSDDGINCQAMIVGYFTNRDGETTPAPLVANMFEYGSSSRKYPKQPFFRQSFNKGEISKAMLRVQDKYIKGD
jgi:hypothetical protein